MLSTNQRQAIQDAVNRGDSLTVEMCSALLAAFEEAQSAHFNVTQQLAQANSEKSQLQWGRDETVRLRREFEKEIDARVQMRTEELQRELSLAKSHQERADKSATFYEKQYHEEREQWLLEQSTMSALIQELKGLVEEQMPKKFIKRLWWNRSARRLLKEVDRLDPRQF
jgi:hypothetical protein